MADGGGVGRLDTTNAVSHAARCALGRSRRVVVQLLGVGPAGGEQCPVDPGCDPLDIDHDLACEVLVALAGGKPLPEPVRIHHLRRTHQLRFVFLRLAATERVQGEHVEDEHGPVARPVGFCIAVAASRLERRGEGSSDFGPVPLDHVRDLVLRNEGLHHRECEAQPHDRVEIVLEGLALAGADVRRESLLTEEAEAGGERKHAIVVHVKHARNQPLYLGVTQFDLFGRRWQRRRVGTSLNRLVWTVVARAAFAANLAAPAGLAP